jgi:hypothetical protein
MGGACIKSPRPHRVGVLRVSRFSAMDSRLYLTDGVRLRAAGTATYA